MKFKILLISTMLLLLGCSLINGPSKTTPKSFEDFTYPLEVGNSWTYETIAVFSNPQPDTVEISTVPMTLGPIEVGISRLDTLDNGLEVTVLNIIVGVYTYPGGLKDTTTYLFKNEDDGFYQYSSDNDNPVLPISRPPSKDEITNFLTNGIKQKEKLSSSANTTIYQNLKYPIKDNSEWLYLDNDLEVRKKIIDNKLLHTTLGDYHCFVVEWIYSNPDIKVVDYISKIGLMKRIYTVKNIRMFITDYVYGDIVDTTNQGVWITVDHTIEYIISDFTQGQ